MMESISMGTIIAISGAVTAIGGAYLTMRSIQKDNEKSKEIQAAKILQDAKEEDALLKASLESRISILETSLKNLETSTQKDLEHIRVTQEGEIKHLGERIESLREELRQQHGQLLSLLSKLIDNK